MKKNNFKISVLLLIILLSINYNAKAQTAATETELFSALAKGDAETLSSFFDKNIDLVIVNISDIYDLQKAKQTLIDFFSANQPEGFQLIHKGDQDAASFVIGNLKTKNENYRVYIIIRGKQPKIQQFRIEKND